jgi:hypothetical protein
LGDEKPEHTRRQEHFEYFEIDDNEESFLKSTVLYPEVNAGSPRRVSGGGIMKFVL